VTKTFKQGGKTKQTVALQNFNLVISEDSPAIVTIAGESGSGKTTLANLLMGFTRPTSGEILYRGTPVMPGNRRAMNQYWREVQAVFQDPFGVFNPFYKVEHTFWLLQRNFRLFSSRSQADQQIEEALNVVGLRGTEILGKYPHQLSGGQRQRIMMARAYLLKPRLIVADEPVSMVDASLRATILDVMLRLKNENGISFVYITHDLSTAYQIGDQIFVLYQGSIAETGRTVDVIERPHHPYVQILVSSVPSVDPRRRWQDRIDLPDEEEMRSSTTSGCRYYPRCPRRIDSCLASQPPLYRVGPNAHRAACVHYAHEEVGDEPLR
jgi:peptide/nickel transport system ATP-binding protein